MCLEQHLGYCKQHIRIHYYICNYICPQNRSWPCWPLGFPGNSGGKEPASILKTWVKKIPWKREWLPTPVLFFFFFFWLEANYFIIMWWFFPYFNTNQPWVYMCPPILNSPSTPPPHSIPLGCPKALALSALLNASALNLYCLENSTEREAWLSTVQGVAKNQIQLNN